MTSYTAMRLVVLTNRVNFRLRDDTRRPHEARVDTNELQGRWNKRRRKKKEKGWKQNITKMRKKRKKRSTSKLHKREHKSLCMPFDVLSILFLRVFLTCLSVLARSVNKKETKKKKRRKIINYFCRFIFSSKFSYMKLSLFESKQTKERFRHGAVVYWFLSRESC